MLHEEGGYPESGSQVSLETPPDTILKFLSTM